MSATIQAPLPTPAPARPSSSPAPVSRRLVQRQCACGGTAGLDGECPGCRRKRLQGESGPVQPKLLLSEPGDPYEREADRVADQVMRSTAAPEIRPGRAVDDDLVQTKPLDLRITPLVQRQVDPEEEEDEEDRTIQMKGATRVQRQVDPDEQEEEDEEILQAKPAGGGATAIDPAIESRFPALAEGGDPLPEEVREFFGSRIGYDFGRVRVRTDDLAADTARRIRARAFTLGRSIAFAPGEYAPGSATGRRLLAHELTHVVQQNPSLPTYTPRNGTSSASARRPIAPAPGAPAVQRDDTDDGPPTIGSVLFFNAAGDEPYEVTVKQNPDQAPPPGIYTLTLKSQRGNAYEFETTIPGIGKYTVMLVEPKKPSAAVRQRMRGAAKTLFAVGGIGGALREEEPEEAEEMKGGGEETEAEVEEAPEGEHAGGGGETVEEPGGGGGGEREEDEEPSEGAQGKKQPGSPEGTGKPGTSGSKYGWLGLIDFLPDWVIRALEKTFETLGNSEDYLALRELVRNLGELDEHVDTLGTLLSSPEKLLEVVLGVEDSSSTRAVEKLGAWVMARRQPRKRRPGAQRARGLAGVTRKVVGLLDKIRAVLRPVFATRSLFQEIVGLASAAVAAPGAEVLLELANDPDASRETVRDKVHELAGNISESLHEQMEQVRALFSLPTEALAESEFVTREELAVAITRAAGRMVPKHVRPFVWAAEKVGLLDLVGKNMVASMVPEGVLETINEQLRSLLSEEVLGPLSREVGPELAEVVTQAGTLLDTAVREVLEEVVIQREPGAPGAAPDDVDEARLHELLGSSRAEPLAPAVRSEMEERTGFDFGRVRVHDDAPAAEATGLLQARAFTRGSDVFFQPSLYSPETPEGRRLLAHELTHVVQQARGTPAGLIQRAAADLARKWVRKAREKVKTGAEAAFTPSPARARTAGRSLRALDRLIGRKVVSDTNPRLPEGYVYVHAFGRQRAPRRGRRGGRPPPRPITGIKRKAGFLLYLPPLRINRSGRIELNLESRLDPNADARRQLRRALACGPKQQAHHVVPLQLQNHPVVDVARSNRWNLNGRDNGECLSITYHYGSHPAYTETVRDRLDDIDTQFGGSTSWDVIRSEFLALVAELKKGLRARKYRMR